MEFNGCWYHGCPRCYPNDRDTLQVMGKTIQQLGLTVHEMWYCDYKLYHESNNLKVIEEPLRI